MEISLQEIKNLPDLPGVYIFKDSNANPLYIGKAKSLIKRIKGHISQAALNPKERKILEKTVRIEYFLTPSEPQALLLEYKLIKEKIPLFNINYRDGKTYPWLKITIYEKYPLLLVTREKKQDRSLYLGPFPNVKKLKEVLKILRPIFPYRSCRRMPNQPCLYYHLDFCPAPCALTVKVEEYRRNIVSLIKVLLGEVQEIIRTFTEKMDQHVRKAEFEEAARMRDKIQALGKVRSIFYEDQGINILKNMQEKLKLPLMPRVIDGIDISNISGEFATGSVVRFQDGLPLKDYYRRFRIKMVEAIDDYAMIFEVITRRYKRAIEEGEPLPDLILIDGGKGQLSSAKKALKTLNLNINVISYAKGKDLVYSPARKDGIKFPEGSGEKALLERIREEAHRFAIRYHQKLRKKTAFLSLLDEIPGIGPKRRQKILQIYKSLDELKKEEPHAIAQKIKISQSLAQKIITHLSQY